MRGQTVRSLSMPGDMRQLLRRATRRQHARLDAISLLTPLLFPEVGLAGYQAAMAAMLRAYQQVDACLLQAPPAAHMVQATTLSPYRPRSPAIQHDLQAMGIGLQPASCGAIGAPGETAATAATAATVPTATLNLPTSLAAYLGMRYVVEGAQFGNRVIGRNLQAAFGPAAVEICSAWLPGADAGNAWPDVMAALSALDSRRDVAAALRGARRMFDYFSVQLCVLPQQRPMPV